MGIYCTDLDEKQASHIEAAEARAQEADMMRKLLFGNDRLVLNEHLGGLRTLLEAYGDDLHPSVIEQLDAAVESHDLFKKKCFILFAIYLEGGFVRWFRDNYPSEFADYFFRAIVPTGIENLLFGRWSLVDCFSEMLFQYASHVPRYVPSSDPPRKPQPQAPSAT